MLHHGQLHDDARSDTLTGEEGKPSLHPSLAALLEHLGIDRGVPPDEKGWTRLLEQLNERYRDLDSVHREFAEMKRGSSSFESLFQTSPVPMMEQDYTRALGWMSDLKRRGVASIRDHIGDDIDKIREVVPLISIVRANPAAVEAVGLPHDEMIGPVDPVIVNPGSEPSWLNQLDAVWNGDAVSQASFVAATADGQQYDAESILSAPIVDGVPDYTRAVFALIDITPHRDEERRMANLVEAKNRFLASVSHEIRTPLTAILGFARVLEEDSDLTGDDRRLMTSSIAEHAQDMSNIVEDLLVAARADIGQLDIISVPIDLAEQIETTLTAGGSFTNDVDVTIATERPRALADPTRVRQILRNLLTNAERYGGDQVSVTVAREADLILVDVVDNGEGLPNEQWERIFQPYESAHTASGRPSAVGIGLTISRELAELMGGSLRYAHEHGVSSFQLALRASNDD